MPNSALTNSVPSSITTPNNTSFFAAQKILTMLGFEDQREDIIVAEQKENSAYQVLRQAINDYEESHNIISEKKLIKVLNKEIKRLEEEYEYIKVKQANYSKQAELSLNQQKTTSYISQWGNWLLNNAKYFFGSDYQSMAERYEKMAEKRKKSIKKLEEYKNTLVLKNKTKQGERLNHIFNAKHVEFHELALPTPNTNPLKPQFRTMNYVGAGEFLINTYTINNQIAPSLAVRSNGGFVITWDSYLQDGSGYGVYGRLYDANRAASSNEFRVNTYTMNNQVNSRVAALNDGGFIVVWSSQDQDGSSYGVYGQRYDASGMKFGSEFRANTYTADYQSSPSVAALHDGGFVIVWQSLGQNNGWDIYGQLYNINGVKSGAEFQVNTYTINAQNTPSVATFNAGGYIVTWHGYGQDSSSSDIYGRRYSASGMAYGSDFQVNTYILNDQQYSSVTILNDDSFVVTWHSLGQDGSGYGIYAQHYNNEGVKAGSEFQVNTYVLSDQKYPSISSLSNGGFVVAWHSLGEDGSGYGIYAQRYNNAGVKSGNEFQVNIYTPSHQAYSSITKLKNDSFIVAWQSNEQDGLSNGNTVEPLRQSDGQDGTAWGIYSRVFFKNTIPTILFPLPDQTASVGNNFNYVFSSTTFDDADNYALTYTAALINGSPLPSWLSFNANTRTFSGVPPKTSVGAESVIVTANDGHGGTVSDTFDLMVSPSLSATNLHQNLLYIEDQPLDLSDISITDTASNTITATLALSDPLVGHLSISASGAVIANYNSQTGVWTATGRASDVVQVFNAVQFIPTLNYNKPVSISVRISDGINDDLTDSIGLTGIAVNDIPIVTRSIPNQSIEIGKPFSYTFDVALFTDPDGGTLTYSAKREDDTDLPTWLNFDTSNRRFYGTPAEKDISTLRIRLSTTNNRQETVSTIFSMNIHAPQESDSLAAKVVGGIAGGFGTALVGFGLWKYQQKKEAAKKRKETHVVAGDNSGEIANAIQENLGLSFDNYQEGMGSDFYKQIRILVNEITENKTIDRVDQRIKLARCISNEIKAAGLLKPIAHEKLGFFGYRFKSAIVDEMLKCNKENIKKSWCCNKKDEFSSEVQLGKL